MEIDDFQKFHEGIAGVMSFYGKSVSRFALDVWWTALRRFDLAAIVEAFNRHLANPDTGQFAPKPAGARYGSASTASFSSASDVREQIEDSGKDGSPIGVGSPGMWMTAGNSTGASLSQASQE